MTRKAIENLLKREYPITLVPAEEGGYLAEHRDLPGCITQGDSVAEAIENLAAARRLWITTAVEHGDEVPAPSTDDRFGGRVLVRMPKSLHRRLFERSQDEGVSLNQLVVAVLAGALGQRPSGPRADALDWYGESRPARVSEAPARRRRP
ncbi:MAG: type II toxin-antitoxin system HicB family antitoxin [Acidobacteria bacterium]|nr:type II toxin-antitoxin system HicB family antitoxin [Acidobacteriota bacterium]